MNEFNQLVENLSWDKDVNIQKDSINRLSEYIEDDKVSELITCYNKPCWHNGVLILKKIGYPRNKKAIPQLIWLFQDMNWPGVDMAIEILKSIEIKDVIPHIEDALLKASCEEDFMWIAGIKRLVKHLKLSSFNFSSEDVYKLLELAEW